MKCVYSILLLLLIAQANCYKDDLDLNKEFAWKIQCQIKTKGTFKLSHYMNKDKSDEKLEKAIEDTQEEMKGVKNEEKQAALQAQLEALQAEKLAIEEKNTEFETTYTEQKELYEGEVAAETEVLAAEDVAPEAADLANEIITDAKTKLTDLEAQREVFLNGRADKVNLFLEDDANSIELPNICKFRLTPSELLELGVKGQEFRDLWLAQYCGEEYMDVEPRPCKPPAPDYEMPEETPPVPTYLDMPPLDKREFTNFYMAATKDVKDRDPDAIYAESAENDMSIVMATAAFGKAREILTWLEFWVYMCADGKQPPLSEYLADESEIQSCEPSDMIMFYQPAAARRSKSSKKVSKKHSQKTLNKRRRQ